MAERLQKILASAGVASRREAEAWIRAGRVRVNGRVARLGESADPARDAILLDGRRLHAEPRAYWLLHKPRGVLSTRRDPHAGARRTVLELLPARARRVRLFPVGRLDADSEGVLLLTNDGEVAQALLHPSQGVLRVYRLTVRGALDAEARAALARGVPLEDGPQVGWEVGPCRVDARRGESTLEVGLREGRKRQIRRTLAALGHPVRRLVRVRMGPLRLGRLGPGEVRALRADEVRALRRALRAQPPAGRGASRPRRDGKPGRASKGPRSSRGND